MATATIEMRGDQAPAETISSSEGRPAIRLLPAPNVVAPDIRPEAQPNVVLLGTLSKLGFRVMKAIPVRLEKQDQTVIASWQDADEFGTGSSMSAACEELGRTVAELYGSLKAENHNLGPDLMGVWRLLQEHVVESK
jgi:hypothetical protein